MFVDCQNFAASWGCYFVGYWLVAIQCRVVYDFVKRSSVRVPYKIHGQTRMIPQYANFAEKCLTEWSDCIFRPPS